MDIKRIRKDFDSGVLISRFTIGELITSMELADVEITRLAVAIVDAYRKSGKIETGCDTKEVANGRFSVPKINAVEASQCACLPGKCERQASDCVDWFRRGLKIVKIELP
jgi:hypothetical protein